MVALHFQDVGVGLAPTLYPYFRPVCVPAQLKSGKASNGKSPGDRKSRPYISEM
jgi:hypothetical protein